ncbi:CHAD domain-containing protein [Pseudoduganella violacea]|uniref:CHAD domain-containing protein n=1 Tax=Pseudoduganella violacea TaxID=1715466 RepID=A0A7W5BFQ4_9BURK|nr:CHAD domain-containing protein [Pseudoduganella violacea]MBB3121440.1 CHAD domain-containing protein [Pseudoduganella violacea]
MSATPVTAKPIVLRKDMSILQAHTAVVAECLRHIEANAPGVAAQADTEFLHQMRIGLRRLNAALHLFRGVRPLPEALRLEVKWLDAALAPARDWEVLANSTLPRIAASAPAHLGLAALLQLAQEAARRHNASAAQAVASPRCRSLLDALHAWAAQTPQGLPQPNARLKHFATALLDSAGKRLRRRAQHLSQAGQRRLHRSRIAAKRLRYTLEFFASLYPQRQASRRIDTLAAFQDALGAINDASVAHALLEHEAASHPGLHTATAYVRGYLQADSRHQVRALSGLWKRLRRAL